jgi:hypothetical protein
MYKWSELLGAWGFGFNALVSGMFSLADLEGFRVANGADVVVSEMSKVEVTHGSAYDMRGRLSQVGVGELGGR